MTGFQFQAALTTTTIGFLFSTLLFGVLRLQEGRGGAEGRDRQSFNN